MGKQTVQSVILDELRYIRERMDKLVPEVEGLKVKAAVAGGVAGIVGTAIMGLVLSAFK